MEAKKADNESHIVVANAKDNKKVRLAGLALVVLLVFGLGLLTGRWLKTNEINNAAKNAVGSQQVSGENYKVTILGEELSIGSAGENSGELRSKLTEKATISALRKAEISEVITVHSIAITTNETNVKANAEKVLKERAKELSNDQKTQLQSLGLNL